MDTQDPWVLVPSETLLSPDVQDISEDCNDPTSRTKNVSDTPRERRSQVGQEQFNVVDSDRPTKEDINSVPATPNVHRTGKDNGLEEISHEDSFVCEGEYCSQVICFVF